MLGSDYRWLQLTPLYRGALLFVAVAGLSLTGLLWSASGTTSRESIEPPVAAETAATHPRSEWPLTLLRVWFLAPSLLPLRDR